MNDDTAALLGRLSALDSNLVSDVMDAAGLPNGCSLPASRGSISSVRWWGRRFARAG